MVEATPYDYCRRCGCERNYCKESILGRPCCEHCTHNDADEIEALRAQVARGDALLAAVRQRAQDESDAKHRAEFGHNGPSVAGVFPGLSSPDRTYVYYRHELSRRFPDLPDAAIALGQRATTAEESQGTIPDINRYGELATWDTTSREYREKISQLTKQHRGHSSDSGVGAYQAGLLTWEHARAELGMESDPSDPRWGRFFVPHSLLG